VTDVITLTPKAAFTGLVDGRALAPDRLAGLTGSQLGALPLPVEGRGAVPLGDLCRIVGDSSQTLRLEGDWSAVNGLGSGMTGGRLEVTGSAGDDVGLGMLAGGEIVIRGRAGNEAGARMRRGVIYVGGAAGAGAGRSMIAGTLVIAGPAGPNLALWNKRGSIIALAEFTIPVTYRYDCSYHPPTVPLLLGRLARLYGARIGAEQIAGRYRRYSGDLAESGKGEILAWMAA
jgi:formylmethanofuran dehydrogenase subunit C